MKANEEISKSFFRNLPLESVGNKDDFGIEIISYSGSESTAPSWDDIAPGEHTRVAYCFKNSPSPVSNGELFKRVCIISADLSNVSVEKCKNGSIRYCTKAFDVVFICGPELKAQIRWKENVRLRLLLGFQPRS